MNKNLSLLTLSQIFGFTANIITVFLSGIVGSQITHIKSLSTLPTALTVLGTAIFTILASKKQSFFHPKINSVAPKNQCFYSKKSFLGSKKSQVHLKPD